MMDTGQCDWFPCDKPGTVVLESDPLKYIAARLCEKHADELNSTFKLYRLGNIGLATHGAMSIPRDTLSAFAAAEESEPMPSHPAEWQDE